MRTVEKGGYNIERGRSDAFSEREIEIGDNVVILDALGDPTACGEVTRFDHDRKLAVIETPDGREEGAPNERISIMRVPSPDERGV